MLTSIDNKLNNFSKSIGATLTKNNTKGAWLPKEYEERSLRWTRGTLNYLIQIFPTIENDRIINWILWASCSSDSNNKRYWKKLIIIQTQKQGEIILKIDTLLQQAHSFLKALTFEDLEFVVDLNPN